MNFVMQTSEKCNLQMITVHYILVNIYYCNEMYATFAANHIHFHMQQLYAQHVYVSGTGLSLLLIRSCYLGGNFDTLKMKHVIRDAHAVYLI